MLEAVNVNVRLNLESHVMLFFMTLRYMFGFFLLCIVICCLHIFQILNCLQTVKTGDTIFIGQYLFMGSETTSIWLEVSEVKGNDVVCIIKNSDSGRGQMEFYRYLMIQQN
ncbi:unnamed protein product [Vicia faba]|uniref:Uncharacterized protein n=1 Tax=Vicia faba TaxID=3906 RepID=A0AAV1B666_VICFA|nr:unnamed protein product [Vicia faba]